MVTMEQSRQLLQKISPSSDQTESLFGYISVGQNRVEPSILGDNFHRKILCLEVWGPLQFGKHHLESTPHQLKDTRWFFPVVWDPHFREISHHPNFATSQVVYPIFKHTQIIL